MSKGRVMGIDFGTRHIGVALSDELWITASGFETVNWNGEDDAWALDRIANIVKEKNVSVIVLGKPSRTDGTVSETEKKAIVFGEKLTELTGITPEMKDERLGYVGNITNIRPEPIMDLLEKGYIPVVSTIGCDKDGNAYNINGDTAAAYIAGAIKAERLIMMTDIAGILKDKDDPDSLIPQITVSEAQTLYRDGIISGGMIPKVGCCIEAIYKGVQKVIIMDGRVPHSILMELMTDEGAGTMVLADEKKPTSKKEKP